MFCLRTPGLSGLLAVAMSFPVVAAEPDALADLSIEDLANLEVTSVSRRPEKLSETPSAIQVVTSDEIHRSGATSIPQALRLASNLNVAQENSQGWVVSARGFTSDVGNKLLVMMDGRTVYTPLFSGVFWYRQDYLLDDLDRIEVISGPGGSVWGANAVNGVINITSKSAKDTQGFHVEGGGGTEYQGFAGLRYGGKVGDDVYYRVYGKYFQRDASELANGDENVDDWYMGQGGFRVDTDVSAQDTLTVQGDYYGTETQEEIAADTRPETRGFNILGRWTRTSSEESDMSLQLYFDRTNLTLPAPPFVIGGTPLSGEGVFGDVLDTVDLDFQHNFRLGSRHSVVWGLGYRYTHDDVDNAPALAFTDGDLGQSLFSGFFQDEVTVIEDKVYFTFGTKIEHTDYTGFEVEPSARVRWNVTDNHMLWGAVSRAVRVPSRIDRDIAQPGPENPIVILAGDEDFKSEKVIAFELGYRGQVTERFNIAASSFYNLYNDVRSASLSPPDPVFGLPFPVFFENNLEGESYGIELSATWQPLDWWQLRGGYTFLEEEMRARPGTFDLNNGLNETADPKNQYSLRSFMDLPNKLSLDATFRWVDRVPMNNSGVVAYVPSYAELDIRLGWQPIESLEVSLVGQNLLHESHPEFGIQGPLSEEIERGIYGKVVWRH